jgi:hypothetical protein
MKDLLVMLVQIAVIVFLLALGPWLVIWAVNELGQYYWPDKVLPFNFWTWASVMILYTFFNGKVAYDKK